MSSEDSDYTPDPSVIPAEQSELTQALKQIIQDAAPEATASEAAATQVINPEVAALEAVSPQSVGPEEAVPEEAIPEAATPEEREGILRGVNQDIRRDFYSDSTTEKFDDDQITEISQDPEKFDQALTQLIAEEPEGAMKCLPYILKHYPPDEARSLIVSLAEKNSPWLYKFMDQGVIKLIGEDAVALIAKKTLEADGYLPMSTLVNCVKKGYFTKEELKARTIKDIETAWNNNPDETDYSRATRINDAFDNTRSLMESDIYTDEEKAEIHDEISATLHSAIQRTSLAESCQYIDQFSKFIDVAELKTILVTKFAEDPTVKLFEFNSSATLDQIFTAEEQLSMLNQSMEQQLADFEEGDNALYQIDFNSIQKIFGDEVLKDIADRVLAVSPEALIRIFAGVGHLYDNQEITDIARVLSTTQSGQEALFAMATGPETKWSDIVDKEVVRELIINADPNFHKDIAQLENLHRYFSPDEISSLASKMLAANPITAVRHPDFFTEHVPGFDANPVLEQALENPAQMAVLGKYLTETIKKAQNGTESARERALTDANEMYMLIERLSRAGRLEGFKELHAKFELKAKTERSLIETYSIISTLGSSEDLAALESIDTIAAVEHIATQALAHSLGIESDVTPERSQRLIDQMGSTVPLGLYVAQYRTSPQHLAVLKPMVEAILDGNYESWKFGAGQESFQAMKLSGLIPANTTEEQYAIWREKSESESSEAFIVEAGTAINTIRATLTTEAAQFPEGSLVDSSEKTAALGAIAQELPGPGRKIAEIHRKLQILREQPDAERDEEQITGLENEVTALSQEMKNLQIRQDIIQLTHLTEEEVSSKHIQLDQKRRPIKTVLTRLRKNLEGDALAVLDRVVAALDSFSEQTEEAQTLRVIDTASPKTTIEIGEVPMASCQNFRNGSINEALLGYTDPNTKVLLLTDEDGTPIARSVFRLLSDEAGNPALHVESIYTRLATDGVTRAIYQHAVQKAKAMGIPLFVSSKSQNDEGVMVESSDVEGITRTPSAVVLSAAQSRAPSVYVDSAGGEKHGTYSMANVATLS